MKNRMFSDCLALYPRVRRNVHSPSPPAVGSYFHRFAFACIASHGPWHGCRSLWHSRLNEALRPGESLCGFTMDCAEAGSTCHFIMLLCLFECTLKAWYYSERSSRFWVFRSESVLKEALLMDCEITVIFCRWMLVLTLVPMEWRYVGWDSRGYILAIPPFVFPHGRNVISMWWGRHCFKAIIAASVIWLSQSFIRRQHISCKASHISIQ